VVVGFGVGTPAQARAVGKLAHAAATEELLFRGCAGSAPWALA
jgi:hypothetical protein